MEISSRLKRKDAPVRNFVPKRMGKYFQGTSKQDCTLSRTMVGNRNQELVEFWLWEATDLLAMMGIDIGVWRYNQESSGSF